VPDGFCNSGFFRQLLPASLLLNSLAIEVQELAAYVDTLTPGLRFKTQPGQYCLSARRVRTEPIQAARLGLMLWFMRKKLVESYLFFSVARRP
jgi:hypothetical protein